MHQPKLDKSEKHHWVSLLLGQEFSAAFCREFDLRHASFLIWKRTYSDSEAPPVFVELVAGEGVVPGTKEALPPSLPVAELAITGSLTNKKRSRIQVRVEHVFGRMSQMGMDLVRTIGKSKPTSTTGEAT